jgi:hypothetical protein
MPDRDAGETDFDVDPPGPLEGYRVALEEGRRSIEAQERTLNEARLSASALLTASAVATTFLATASFEKDANGGKWVTVGMILFALVTIASIAVLLPVWKFAVEVKPHKILFWIEDRDPPLKERGVLRNLAYWKQEDWKANRRRIFAIHCVLASGWGLLPFELASWAWPLIF